MGARLPPSIDPTADGRSWHRSPTAEPEGAGLLPPSRSRVSSLRESGFSLDRAGLLPLRDDPERCLLAEARSPPRPGSASSPRSRDTRSPLRAPGRRGGPGRDRFALPGAAAERPRPLSPPPAGSAAGRPGPCLGGGRHSVSRPAGSRSGRGGRCSEPGGRAP